MFYKFSLEDEKVWALMQIKFIEFIEKFSVTDILILSYINLRMCDFSNEIQTLVVEVLKVKSSSANKLSIAHILARTPKDQKTDIFRSGLLSILKQLEQE